MTDEKTEEQLADERAKVEKAAEVARALVPPEPNYDPRTLQLAFDKITQKGPDASSLMGGDVIPRKRIEFLVDVDDMAPGVFDQDIRIGLVNLTSAQELKAVKDITDPAAAVALTVKATLETLNGAPIPPGDQVDFVWEALGPGGRQVVITMYQQIGSVTPKGMGKSLESSTKR